MSTLAELKTARTSAKRAVTKQVNKIRQCIAEDNLSDIDDNVVKLKDLFKEFTAVHDEYHAMLIDDDDVDASETYFYKEQDVYISVLHSTKDVKIGVDHDNDSSTPKSGTCGDLSREKFLGLLNLPKVELQVFDGNPLHYHQFLRAFEVNVDKVCDDSDLKLARLMQYTSGSAKEAIRGCQLIGGPSGYSQARSILDSRFGNEHLVTERLIKELKVGKQLRSPQEIQQLADDMKCTLLTLTQLGTLDEVKSQSFILDVVSRLPNYVQLRWKKSALKSKKDSQSYPEFKDLVDFVGKIANEVNDPVYGSMHPKRFDRHKSTSQGVSLNSCVSTQSQSGSSSKSGSPKNVKSYAKPEPPCVLCTRPHRLWHCDKFKQMIPRERLNIVTVHKLCHNCLLASHTTDNCGKRSVCGVKGCGRKHTMYIHCPDIAPPETKVSNVSYHEDKETHMPIVQVTVNSSRKVLALLDSGSSNSFCSKGLVHSLGLQGRPLEFQLSTLNKSGVHQSKIVDLSIGSESGETMQMNGVCVVDSIPVKSTPVDVSLYAHFDGVGLIPAYDHDNMLVDLLIGQDNAEALVPLEVRRGRSGQPFAVRTLFGWCVNGQSPVSRVSRKVVSNFVSCLPAEDVSKLWKIENEGLECSSWSQEDKSVIKLWDQEHRKIDGHYELPIPWRDRAESLPNNFVVAKSRLDSLDKRLVAGGLYPKYSAEIDKLLCKGYAERIPPDEMTGERIWYLPHHAVITDKKPDKLRVVYDCASKFRGKSLNDRCLQGPDLVNKLLPVLLRFRQHSIAIQADIEAMYNQVKIPPQDRDALRFLWYRDGHLEYYRMTSHLFGGVWCASSSTYALSRTVIDTPDVSPLVRYTVDKSFYVDDCLSSVASKNDAETVIRETPRVLSNGGFSLKKFVVNDEELLSEVSEDCVAEGVRTLGPVCESRALGIKWKISTDEFFFEVGCDKQSPITRKKMLSAVASIFDPLGLLGPVVLTGKLLFQKATADKLSWDETVPAQLENAWYAWVRSCHAMKQLNIPRCVKPREFDDAWIELHHFSDASSRAYGCCSYIRCVNKYGGVHVQLLLSKSRVAPLKMCTILRLELQAAVVAAKVDALLRHELDLDITSSYFWTDSEIVLKYINNDSRRFHVFVGNRVSLIRELTNPDQWHHIDGKSNPADLVTRPQSCLKSDDKWFHGPDILHKYKHDWDAGEKEPVDLDDDDPEVRESSSVTAFGAVATEHLDDAPRVSVCHANQVVENDPLDKIMHHYSSWYRMKRALAWWLRFMEFLKKREPAGQLTVKEIHHAGEILVRKAQSQSFASEIGRLEKGTFVKASSSMRVLNPYLDDQGLLRMNGRVKGDNKVKNPLIISGNHM
ncbi:uncharacterized protein LOC119740069 [Patiria miniata]|uniref:Gag-pol polyprotein n=1 Tax=Patiria miniata TaxID=46514 RepID=A0A914B6W5_PATMI|nr:uncharacterized protein LOC119740069 [Patiria miniata]